MATYSAANYLTKPVPTHGLSNGVYAIYMSVSATAALTTSDVLNFGYVPENFRVVSGFLDADDLDTNGTPTLALNIGDADDADRLFAASAVGQAGTASNDVAVAGLGYKYEAKTLITGAPSTNAATGAAGGIRLCLVGYIEDDTTS